MRQRASGETVISFEETAFAELCQWEKDDKKIFEKIVRLITEVVRDPFHGTGKPELLKRDWSGPLVPTHYRGA